MCNSTPLLLPYQIFGAVAGEEQTVFIWIRN